MMNSCSLSKAYFLTLTTLFLVLAALAYHAYRGEAGIIEYGLSLLTLLVIGLTFKFLRNTMRALQRCERAISKLSEGDFEARIVHIKEKGRLGELANRLNHLADIVDAFVREACNSMEAVSEGRYYRKVIETGMPGLFHRSALAINAVTKETEKRLDRFKSNADMFEEKIKGIVESVMLSSEELHKAAESMLKTAEMTSQESSSAAISVNHTSHGVTVVSDSVGQLSSSIAGIDERVQSSVGMIEKARDEAMRANELIRSLDEAARNIGNIIGLITDIAEQTNLLALNATIEAARAGDAGKGFAVVAGEVKGLAAQTAKATEEISTQVTSIQSVAEKAVKAIGWIGETIHEINNMSADIRLSVNEQMAAAQEIARSAQSSSENVVLVSGNVEKVGVAAIDTKSASTQVLSAAKGLNSQSHTLHKEVESFLMTVRSNNRTAA